MTTGKVTLNGGSYKGIRSDSVLSALLGPGRYYRTGNPDFDGSGITETEENLTVAARTIGPVFVNVTAPVAGQHPVFTASADSTHCEIPDGEIFWHEVGENYAIILNEGDVFRKGQTYRAVVQLRPTQGGVVNERTPVQINGQAAKFERQLEDNVSAQFSLDFPPLGGAVMPTEISAVAASVPEPAGGAEPAAPTIETAGVTLKDYKWFPVVNDTPGAKMAPGEKFTEGSEYLLFMEIVPQTGSIFTDPITHVTVNGVAQEKVPPQTSQNGKIAKIFCFFTAKAGVQTPTEISAVAASVPEPAGGAEPAAPTIETAGVTLRDYKWHPLVNGSVGAEMTPGEKFTAGSEYLLMIEIEPQSGSIFRVPLTENDVTVNGDKPQYPYPPAFHPQGKRATIFCFFTAKAEGAVTPISHTVSFDANGHGNAPAAQTVEYGKNAVRPADLTESGWIFGGWYKEADCVTAFDFDTAITADVQLYAKWTKLESGGAGNASGNGSGNSAGGQATDSNVQKATGSNAEIGDGSVENDRPVKTIPRYDGGGSGGGSSSGRRAAGNAEHGVWKQDEKGWWYQFSDGTWPKGTWKKLNWNGTSAWYFFDENGYMKTGWLLSGGKWYYLGEVSDGTLGAMKTGWYRAPEDGFWYYLSPADGAMATGWQEIGGKQYYLNPETSSQTRGQDASGERNNSNLAASRPLGSMYRSETTPDGHRVDESGARLN